MVPLLTFFMTTYPYCHRSALSKVTPQTLSCFQIHPLIKSLQAVLNIGYLDDVILGGLIDTVATDVRRIVEVGSSMGLILNSNKCEIVTHPGQEITDSILQTFVTTPIENVCLLGSPFFAGCALDEEWSNRCGDLTRAMERLKTRNTSRCW